MHFIRPWLAIGKLSETYDVPRLTECKIGAMLQIAEPIEQAGIVALYLPAEDGEPLSSRSLQKGVAFVREQRAAGRNTLIACGLGISRSVTFTIAAVKEIEAIPLLDAFGEVRKRHPEARPHPVLWQSLCTYYREDIPYLTMLRHKDGA